MWVYQQTIKPDARNAPIYASALRYWSESNFIGFHVSAIARADTIVRTIKVHSSVDTLFRPVIEAYRKIIETYDPSDRKKIRNALSVFFNGVANQLKVNFCPPTLQETLMGRREDETSSLPTSSSSSSPSGSPSLTLESSLEEEIALRQRGPISLIGAFADDSSQLIQDDAQQNSAWPSNLPPSADAATSEQITRFGPVRPSLKFPIRISAYESYQILRIRDAEI